MSIGRGENLDRKKIWQCFGKKIDKLNSHQI